MEGQGTGGPNLEPRVRQLEHSVDALHTDLNRLNSSVSTISSQVSSFTKTLDSVAEKLDVQRTKRPELSAMAGVVAVILAIGSAALWPINDKIDRSLNAIEEQQRTLNQRGVIIGEFYADRRHLEQDIERLQDKMDRLHQ